MEWTHLVAFNLTLFAALASPGPAMLIALRATLAGGRMHGIMTGVGLSVMATIWMAMALLGLDAIFALFPWAYVTLKTAGAAYLIWLAIKMWRTADHPLGGAEQTLHRHRAVLTGLSANLANPKSIMFAASVLIVIFPQSLSVGEKTLIVLNQLIVELVAYTSFAVALSTASARAGYLRLKPVLDRIAGVVLGGLGLRLILTK